MREAILRRIQERENEAIQQRAQRAADASIASEASTSERAILVRQARLLGKTLSEKYDRQKNRGFLGRLLNRNDMLLEEFSDRKANILVFGSGERQFKHNTMTFYTGVRTPMFDIETVPGSEYMFHEGWTVGVVRTQTELSMHMPRKVKLGPNGGPIKIWRKIVEQTSGESEQNLQYEVSCATGEFDSFTNGVRDDHLQAIGRQAGMHALALINHSLELLSN